jgi:predicted PurR-regulated permease PerM
MEQPAAPAGSPGRGWRGRPPRDVLLLLAGAAVLLIAFWLVIRLRSLLVMLLISFFLSFALEPPVNRLAGLGWRRGLGTAAVFAAIVVAVVVFVAALGALLVDQVGGLVDAIPAGAVGLSTTLVGLVMQGFTIGLFTFYLVADAPVPARDSPGRWPWPLASRASTRRRRSPAMAPSLAGRR